MLRAGSILASSVMALGVLGGCDGFGGEGTGGSGGPAVTVFAAASLSRVFPEIDAAAGTGARFSFDGSSGLVDQLSGGAQADVLATADTATMDRARAAGLLAGEPVAFATNELALSVEPGNPLGLTGAGDLAADRLGDARLVVCDPSVPCGRATRELAADLGLDLAPVSEEPKVTDVVGKIAAGEADAGIVYRTDARDGVELVELDGAAAHRVTLQIAVLAGARNPDGAAEVVAAVTGESGQGILAAAGFGPP